jgi:hypothetical protein
MTKQISDDRKVVYYLGKILIVIGTLLFFSTFLSAAVHFGDFHDFGNRNRSMMMRAFGGMGLMILGGIIQGIGARGLAGSGVLLDPQKAREDLEPYTRMAGGMVKDALDEADLTGGANISIGGGKAEKVVMIKCRACGKLNEEDSKFCQECGAKL